MDILKLLVCVALTSFFCYLQVRKYKKLVEKVNKLEQDVEGYKQLTIKVMGDMQTVKQELVGLCNWLAETYVNDTI